MEAIAALIISLCPDDGGLDTTTCHEYVNNCAVDKHGNVTEKDVLACFQKYKDQDESSSVSSFER